MYTYGAPATPVPGRLLVKPRPGAHEPTIQTVFSSQGAFQEREIKQIGLRILKVPVKRADAILSSLSRNPNIEYAQPDYIVPPELVPNDAYYNLTWHPPVIGLPEAWDTTTGASSVTIAILDTGINASHADLANNVLPGWNFYDNNPDTTDLHGHGTGVAGQAAARGNNGIGTAAPAWNCRIMPLKVADDNGGGLVSAMASALVYAADRGARVANLSFNVSGDAPVITAAEYFQSKGGVVTISAGNQGVFETGSRNPAVLTVGATDNADAIASFSNTGNNIDLVAPGVNIVTTTYTGGYGYGTGTSASAPIVAGVAALVLSVNPSLTGPQLRDLLLQSVDDLGVPGWDTTFGVGRINARKAVLAAKGAAPGDLTAPVCSITSPSAETTLAANATVAISASDNIAVTRVEWKLDGVVAGTSATPFAQFSWDTKAVANGSHSLSAVAYDAAGNSGSSATVSVTVANPVADELPPQVRITSPAAGVLLGKSTVVTVSATDNVGVKSVTLYVDGKLFGTSTNATPSFTWNTSKLRRDSSHTLQATAADRAGNIARSAVVTVRK